MQLILASESERRKDILSWLGVPFTTITSGFDESLVEENDPEELVATLAAAKANEVISNIAFDEEVGGRRLVMAADTIVFLDGEVIGKPKDRQHAGEIIRSLRGKTHEVWTGVCLMDMDTLERRVEVEKSKVTFRDFGEKELEDYLDTNEWEGKAGAYMVRGEVDSFIREIDGGVTNVMGLPMELTAEMLEDFGVMVDMEQIKQIMADKTGKYE